MPSSRLALALAAALALSGTFLVPQHTGRAAAGPALSWKAAQQTLSQLSQTRQQTVASLFQLNERLHAAIARLSSLTAEAAKDRAAAQSAQAALASATSRYDAARGDTIRLLRLVEYMGPSSYASVLLGSESFDDFSRRLGAVGATLSAVKAQLAALRSASAAKLSAQQAATAAANQAASAKAAEAAQIKSLTALKAKDSAALAALGSQRADVLSQLGLLQQSWVQKVHPYLQSIRKAVASLPSTVNNIPGTTVSLGTQGATITIPQSGLNAVFQKIPALSDLAFTLTPSGATLNIPSQSLTMQGTFVAKPGDLLVFDVRSASFSGIPLDPSLISQALDSQGIAMNLSSVLQGATLTSVTTASQEITLTAGLSF